MYYRGMGAKTANGSRTEATGAYIFRPNGTEPLPAATKILVEVVSVRVYAYLRNLCELSEFIRARGTTADQPVGQSDRTAHSQQELR